MYTTGSWPTWCFGTMPKGTNNVDIEPQSKARRFLAAKGSLNSGKVGSTVSYCSRFNCKD